MWPVSASCSMWLSLVVTEQQQKHSYLLVIFQDDPGKLIPACHHSGCYWSKDDGVVGRQLELLEVKSSSQLTTLNTQLL